MVLPRRSAATADLRLGDDIECRLFEQPDYRAHRHVLAGDRPRRRADTTARLQVAGQQRRHRDIALGIEQFHVEPEFTKKAALDGQIEMKKIQALARIADENLFAPPRGGPQQREHDET